MNTIHGKMKMFSTILTQKSPNSQHHQIKVYEYALTVVNSADNDTQVLTAAFTSFPSLEDWQHWLSGWNSCGYSLNTEPVLIRTI